MGICFFKEQVSVLTLYDHGIAVTINIVAGGRCRPEVADDVLYIEGELFSVLE